MAYGPQDVADQYQSVLGRAPTSAESDYLNKFLQEGSLQPYELGQILQGSPEFQKTQLMKNGQQYSDLLGASDANILGKAGAQIQSQFAEQGRPVSSGQIGALAQAGQNLAQQRQSALASFYGNGLNQNQSLYAQGGQNALDRGYGIRDNQTQFSQNMALANQQNGFYQNYLNQANRIQRNQGLGSAIGGGLGLIGGGLAGGPMGAAAGGGAGSRIGSGLGGLF